MKKLLLTAFLTVASCLVAGAQQYVPFPFVQPSFEPNLANKLTVSTVNDGSPQLLTIPVTWTNFLLFQSPLVVSGAPAGFTALNGTYILAWTNATGGGGFPQAVWTNTANTNIIYLRDQGDNIKNSIFGELEVVIEGTTNDPNWFVSTAANGTYNIPSSPTGDANIVSFPELDGVLLTITYVTNAVVSSSYSGVITNVFTLPTGAPTNSIFIDPLRGVDAFATVNKYKVPFKTLRATSLVASNGDHIFLNGGYYDEKAVSCTFPQGIYFHANGSTVASALVFSDNTSVYNLNTRYGGTHFSSTNQNSNIQVRDCNFYGENSGDGIDIDSWKGSLDFYNCFLGSGWDGVIVDDLSGLATTNGVITFNNCIIKIDNSTNSFTGAISSGSHGINWFVNNKGGKIILNGGSCTVINATNQTFSSSDGQGNSCFLISYKSGQSAFGTASIELNGPAINYGTTNASVWVSAISNKVVMPIAGWYMSNMLAGSLSAPLNHSVHVILNR